MTNVDAVELSGTVIRPTGGGFFLVQTDVGEVLAKPNGKISKNNIRILADKVTLEVSQYDLTKGRITYRHKG